MVFINSLRSLHFIYQSFENVFGITYRLARICHIHRSVSPQK